MKRSRAQAGFPDNWERAKRIQQQRAAARAIGILPKLPARPQAITERKYFDSEKDGLTVPTVTTTWAGAEFDPGTLNTLFAPVTGDDISNRSGRKVQVIALKLRIRYELGAQTNQTVADQMPLFRIILVQDCQSNSAQLNAEDVISSGTGLMATEMFQNTSFFGRFKVLKDKTFRVQMPPIAYDGTNIEQGGGSYQFKWFLKFKTPIDVHFNGTNGGTIADIVDNSFHIIAGQTVAGMITAGYKCRVVFLDQ